MNGVCSFCDNVLEIVRVMNAVYGGDEIGCIRRCNL
jgi:hypothetical protein